MLKDGTLKSYYFEEEQCMASINCLGLLLYCIAWGLQIFPKVDHLCVIRHAVQDYLLLVYHLCFLKQGFLD